MASRLLRLLPLLAAALWQPSSSLQLRNGSHTPLQSRRVAPRNSSSTPIQLVFHNVSDIATGLTEQKSVTNLPLWDGLAVIGSDDGHVCSRQSIGNGVYLKGGSPPMMCLRGYSDIVSNGIREKGYWEDCPALATLWTSLPDRSGQVGDGHNKLYVDIGANIGACLLPMMARPDVKKALAFEPNPKNLFYLTSSILANPDTKAKVTLYPVGLGKETSKLPIYMENGNAGNSVIGRPTHASSQPSAQVQVRKLDDILMDGSNPPYIHLMKLDAQGFEVNIIQGAKKLFESGAVNAIKFELATDWLVQQGTSSAEYFNVYMQHGYQIHKPSNMLLLTQEALHHWACGPPVIEDFVAIRAEAVTQQPVDCR